MKIAHVAYEVAPMYKVGGLGDVAGSLPKALEKLDLEIAVVMPGYGFIQQSKTLPGSHVPVFYVKHPLFEKQFKYYDGENKAQAYAYFAIGALEELKRQKFRPDIIHCHDWHAAIIPLLLKKQPDAYFEKTKTVLTIHNIGYQGTFACKIFTDHGVKKLLDCVGEDQKRISFLKEGLANADFITTVSPNHAREIRNGKAAFGLKSTINKKRGKFVGILNGIDYDIWNPRTDRLIKYEYNKTNVLSQKAKNKVFLQKKVGMEDSPDIPLFGFIARLTEQKGLDILIPLLETIPKQRIQVVILGSGEKRFERQLLDFKKRIDPRWYSVNVAFDDQMAHEIYAGSDFFLIPSLYEPCGLTQMIAMAYGSIPVATSVGGLEDTIMDAITGFLTEKVSSQALAIAIERASDLWEHPQSYKHMVEQVMDEDFSWDKSAREYVKVYHHVMRM